MSNLTIAQLFDLTGKSAIVTGSATGIGSAIAARLAEAGSGVIIADIDLEGAKQTAGQINAKGGKAEAIFADVSHAADVKRTVQFTIETFGHLDILVNNAAIYPASSALQITEDMWDKVLDLNLKGVFLLSQSAAQEMIKTGKGGRIINIVSEAAIHPSGIQAHYDASKAGAVMLTKSLALEFGPYKITVNAVAPATTRTLSQERVFDQAAKMMGQLSGQQLMDDLAARTPLRRLGEPDDIATAVLFFAGAAADYVTGSFLLVDGGYSLL